MFAKLDKEDISKMKYNDVKKLAKDMNIDTSGSKQDIVDRICSVEVEVDEITEEEKAALENEYVAEESEEAETDDKRDTEQAEINEAEEEQTTMPENENNAQNAENEQKTDDEESEESNRLAIEGIVKVIFNGQVRLRRTPHFSKENVVKLAPRGATFRTVAIVKNENDQAFYELSNGAFIAKDDKLVQFDLR